MQPWERRQVMDKRACILVVEDSQDEAYYLRMRLRAEGYDVLTAGNGRDAMRLVTDELADLVLLDVGLPDMDGFDVCRQIRSLEMEVHGHSPVLPVVMVTGRPAED